MTRFTVVMPPSPLFVLLTAFPLRSMLRSAFDRACRFIVSSVSLVWNLSSIFVWVVPSRIVSCRDMLPVVFSEVFIAWALVRYLSCGPFAVLTYRASNGVPIFVVVGGHGK